MPLLPPLFPRVTQNSSATAPSLRVVRFAGDSGWRNRTSVGQRWKQLKAWSRNRVYRPNLIWTTNSNSHKGVTSFPDEARGGGGGVPRPYPVGGTQARRSSVSVQKWRFTSSASRRYGGIMTTSSHSAHGLLIPPPPRKKSVHRLSSYSGTVVDIMEYNNLEYAELQTTRHNQTFA